MRQLTPDFKFTLLIGLLITISTIVIAFVFQNDYVHQSEFIYYRLARNISHGNGLVYNTHENTLVTLSPFYSLLLSLTPNSPDSLATWISIFSYSIAGFYLALFLKKHAFTNPQIIVVTLVFIGSWNVWINFHSPFPIIFAFSMVAFSLSTTYPTQISLLSGLMPLFHPLGIIPLLLIGIHSRPSNYWKPVWIPSLIWLIIALLTYTPTGFDGLLTVPNNIQSIAWHNILWLAMFILSIGILFRSTIEPLLWLFPLWTSIELLTQLILGSTPSGITSLALPVTVGLGIITLWRTSRIPHNKLIASIIVGGLLALIFLSPPQTTETLEQDIAIGHALALTSDATLAHNRSDALTYSIENFTGEVYHLGGRYSPELTSLADYEDWQSLLVSIAPDYVLRTPDDSPIDFQAPNIQALHYELVADTNTYQLWQRQSSITEFSTQQDNTFIFSPDISLVGITFDHERISPNETLRVRLDWSLNRTPEDGMTINLTLIDINGVPIASIFPYFPQENWEALDLSTYHALHLPENVEYGVYRLQVTLDYQAGLLGRHSVGEVLVPISEQFTTPETPVGMLGSVILHQVEFTYEIDVLSVDLLWSTQTPLDRDYRVFVHITPVNDLQPITQDDGLITNGHYPTSWWLPDEIVPESRHVSIENLPAGDYRVNIGIYTPETGRLQGANGDFLTVVFFTLTDEGRVIFPEN